MGIKVGIKGATLRQVRVLQGKQVLSAFVIIIRVELVLVKRDRSCGEEGQVV